MLMHEQCDRADIALQRGFGTFCVGDPDAMLIDLGKNRTFSMF